MQRQGGTIQYTEFDKERNTYEPNASNLEYHPPDSNAPSGPMPAAALGLREHLYDSRPSPNAPPGSSVRVRSRYPVGSLFVTLC